MRDLQKNYRKFGIQSGYASSPILLDGALYLQNLQGMYTDDPSYVLAIDAATGRTIWKVDRPTAGTRRPIPIQRQLWPRWATNSSSSFPVLAT